MAEEKQGNEFVEKLIKLNRVAKVVKGGRRFSFSALVVVGDQNGRVGYALGKANDVAEAIRKGMDRAKRSMISVPRQNSTIPHPILCKFKGSKVILLPAVDGTGVIAGGAVRAIMDACGIRDVLSKIQGSRNAISVIQSVFAGFQSSLNVQQVSKARERSLQELWN